MDALDEEIINQIDAMSAALSRQPEHDLYGPAKFWESLGEKHKALIRDHGFGKFKQTINFEYHQWEVLSLRDPKIRNLMRQLLKSGSLPNGLVRAKIDAKQVAGIEQIKPTAYAAFMGLLWQYALLKDQLGCLEVCSEPMLGDPIPVTYQGKLISQDLATSSLELNRIAQHVDMSQVKTIAEIGAGYGRLAYLVMIRFPGLEYSIFDVPPALAISQNYLASTLGEDAVDLFREDAVVPEEDSPRNSKVKAFLPHQMKLFPDDYFDLVINISSFDEMPREQIENYISLIDQKCARWLYLKGHVKAAAAFSGGGVAQFPYPSNWKLIYQGRDPFSPNFVERIYSLR